MKLLCKDYIFDPLLKQISINVSDSISLANVVLITNVTTNTIIYNFASPILGGSMQNNILTLDYDTTLMSVANELQIFLDINGSPASEDTVVALKEQIILMKRLLMLLNPIATQDSASRQRVVIDNITAGSVTVAQATASSLNANVGTVASVTNIAGIGGVDPRFQFIDSARVAYSTSIRSNLKSS